MVAVETATMKADDFINLEKKKEGGSGEAPEPNRVVPREAPEPEAPNS